LPPEVIDELDRPLPLGPVIRVDTGVPVDLAVVFGQVTEAFGIVVLVRGQVAGGSWATGW
jgi:hypothetical protein